MMDMYSECSPLGFDIIAGTAYIGGIACIGIGVVVLIEHLVPHMEFENARDAPAQDYSFNYK